MFEKITKIVFVVLFLLMLVIPLLNTNLKQDCISEAENRKLASFPKIHTEDGNRNAHFNEEFEQWINDNIGFRSDIVIANARAQYYIFHVLANNSNMYLGPYGELNYATKEMLLDYQHLNLYSEDGLRLIANSYQTISDYCKAQNAQFYYYQCWDKHSVYPEYFPNTVKQFGNKSKTDGIVEALQKYTDVNVISPKHELISQKKKYQTYSKWGDPTHWTQRGAYIGYLKLMEQLNADNGGRFRELQEADYTITQKDLGWGVFGGIHEVDILEDFTIKKAQAVLTNEKLTVYGSDVRHCYYTNESAGNQTRLLVIGDSYFQSFIMDDLAESFYETVLIWGDYCADIKNIMDAYHPDIVVVEAAERVDRSGGIIEGARLLQTEE